MNNIFYDDKIIVPKDNKYNYYYNFLNRLEQRDCVKFSLFCAKIINPNTKETNLCIGLVEKWLLDEESVTKQELYAAAYATYDYTSNTATYTVSVSNSAVFSVVNATFVLNAAYAASAAINFSVVTTTKINKYLQILLRKTKQFQNNKILEQISKTDVDTLELVDWNMITDIMQEEYNVIHEFSYEDIFSRRCLIELLRREYL